MVVVVAKVYERVQKKEKQSTRSGSNGSHRRWWVVQANSSESVQKEKKTINQMWQ